MAFFPPSFSDAPSFSYSHKSWKVALWGLCELVCWGSQLSLRCNWILTRILSFHFLCSCAVSPAETWTRHRRICTSTCSSTGRETSGLPSTSGNTYARSADLRSGAALQTLHSGCTSIDCLFSDWAAGCFWVVFSNNSSPSDNKQNAN